MLGIAQKFEFFLDRYRHPDGHRWSGQELQDATGGVVTRSYVSTLKKGKIANPGFDRLLAIAKAMGFPPELWFGEVQDGHEPEQPGTVDRGSIAERLDRLFGLVKDERTGEPYTNAEVARMSLGDLTEEEIEGIRTGRIEEPTVSQILSLSEVFGITPSYFLEKSKKLPLLDEDTFKVLVDRKSLSIANKSLNLSDGEKELVIDMIERLGYLHGGRGKAV